LQNILITSKFLCPWLCEKWKALVEGFHENPSLQSKDNIVPRNDERNFFKNLKLLHPQSKK
jgi:hypothetical protein